MNKFKNCKYWIFDIDDTLYPKSSGLDKIIENSLSRNIAELFNISLEDARELCVDFYKKFGSTLYGLLQTTDIKPSQFVRKVHQELDLSVIKPNPRLASALEKIDVKKYVFTNGSYCHGLRVCKKLGIEKEFSGFFGAQSTNFIPKPNPKAFEEFFKTYQINPTETLLIDDGKKNLEAASKMGSKTLWIAQSEEELFDLPNYIDDATTDIVSWLEKYC